MTALPFRPPAAVVTEMRGNFQFDNDSLWWKGVRASMPASHVSGDGSYAFSSGDMTLTLRGAPAAFADLRWLYPRLPSEGGGTLDFAMRWKGDIHDYTARNADVAIRQRRVQGRLRPHAVRHVRAARHESAFREPRHATRGATHRRFQVATAWLIHRARRGEWREARATGRWRRRLRRRDDRDESGGRCRRDRLRDQWRAREQSSFAIAPGAGGAREGVGGPEVSSCRFLASSRERRPCRAIRRRSSPEVSTSRTTIAATTRSSPVRRRFASRLAARRPGWTSTSPRRPVSLAEVGRFAPAVGLQGSAVGPIHLTGSLANLAVSSDLRLPDGGQLVARGTVGLTGAQHYDLALGMKVFNLHTVVAKGPGDVADDDCVGARVRVHAGDDERDLRGGSRGVEMGQPRRRQRQRARRDREWSRDGAEAELERRAHTRLGERLVSVSSPSRTGTLTYNVDVDSLGALDRLLPHTGPDTGSITSTAGRDRACR